MTECKTLVRYSDPNATLQGKEYKHECTKTPWDRTRHRGTAATPPHPRS